MASKGRPRREGVPRTSAGRIGHGYDRETVAEKMERAIAKRGEDLAGIPLPGTAAIYIMRASDRVKLGVSSRPAYRAAALERETGLSHTIEWSARGEDGEMRKLERAAHKLLQTTPFHIQGEWYRASIDSLAEFVTRLAERRGVELDRTRLESRKAEPMLETADIRVASADHPVGRA